MKFHITFHRCTGANMAHTHKIHKNRPKYLFYTTCPFTFAAHSHHRIADICVRCAIYCQSVMIFSFVAMNKQLQKWKFDNLGTHTHTQKTNHEYYKVLVGPVCARAIKRIFIIIVILLARNCARDQINEEQQYTIWTMCACIYMDK